MRLGLTLIFLLSIQTFFGQSKKFKKFADTTKVEVNPYLSSTSYNEFISSTPEVNDVLDLENINQNLLNATVFYTFNKMRQKKRRVEIELSKSLFEAANVYGYYYRSSSFKPSEYNSRKAKKAIKYINKKNDYHVHYINTFLNKSIVFDKSRFRNFYHDKNQEEGDGYYYGIKPKRGDTIQEIEPIPLYTYLTFAEQLVNDFFSGASNRISKNKAITLGACYVFISEENVNKSYLPFARVLFVLGGKRTDLLPE